MANKIDYGASLEILDRLPTSVVDTYKKLVAKGYQFWIVNSNRGYCNYLRKEITIPLWAYNRDAKYYTWYFCHEMAHALAPIKDNHGPAFMQTLIEICPEDCIKHELGYKPRNAQAAGIGEVKFIDISML